MRKLRKRLLSDPALQAAPDGSVKRSVGQTGNARIWRPETMLSRDRLIQPVNRRCEVTPPD
jgi:hypothetical protein